MIPFDGQFAENVVLPLAQAAYDSTHAPTTYTLNQTAFEILANPAHPAVQNHLARLAPPQRTKRQKMLQSMLVSRSNTSRQPATRRSGLFRRTRVPTCTSAGSASTSRIKG